jgi:hypothetical protein
MVNEEALNELQYHVQKSMTNYEYDHGPSTYFTKILFMIMHLLPISLKFCL